MFKKMFKSEKGFTLLELVIVIGILAVISAIAMPAISGRGKGAKTAAHQANLNSLANAIESYAQEFELKAADFQVELTDAHPIVVKGFLRSIPRNPWFDTDTFDTDATPTNTYAYKYVLDYTVITNGLVKKVKPVARLADVAAGGAIAASKKEIVIDASGKEAVATYTSGTGGF